MDLKRFGKDAILHWYDRKRIYGMPISFTKYYIIEKPGRWIKLFVETGVVHTQLEEVHLYKIDDFSLYESVIDKVYKVGNIDVYHSDASDAVTRITRVKNVYKAYDILTDLIEKDKKARNIRYSEFNKS